MRIDAADIYDKALKIIDRALDGHSVEYESLNAANEVIKPAIISIYMERSRGQWQDTLDDAGFRSSPAVPSSTDEDDLDSQ